MQQQATNFKYEHDWGRSAFVYGLAIDSMLRACRPGANDLDNLSPWREIPLQGDVVLSLSDVSRPHVVPPREGLTSTGGQPDGA